MDGQIASLTAEVAACKQAESSSSGSSAAPKKKGAEAEIARRKTLLYVPADCKNPFPERPKNLESDMPQIFPMYGDKTHDALSKKTASSMKYEYAVLAPAFSYMHGSLAFVTDTVDGLDAEAFTPDEIYEWDCVYQGTEDLVTDTILKEYIEEFEKGKNKASLFDLQDGYHAVGIDPDFQKYMQFDLQGQLFQCTALPSGCSYSPRIFVKFMKVMVEALRSPGAEAARACEEHRLRGDTGEVMVFGEASGSLQWALPVGLPRCASGEAVTSRVVFRADDQAKLGREDEADSASTPQSGVVAPSAGDEPVERRPDVSVAMQREHISSMEDVLSVVLLKEKGRRHHQVKRRLRIPWRGVRGLREVLENWQVHRDLAWRSCTPSRTG
eukprot:gene34336-biopygen26090